MAIRAMANASSTRGGMDKRRMMRILFEKRNNGKFKADLVVACLKPLNLSYNFPF
jgi:hypothetical protein